MGGQLSEILKKYNEITDAGLDLSTARAIGLRALLAQIGDRMGGTDTRCDDCNSNGDGYFEDLLRDYRIKKS